MAWGCLLLFYNFTTMFIMIIVVCSLCIPWFVSISRCVSELHGHLSSYHYYGLRLFIVVLQELHCLRQYCWLLWCVYWKVCVYQVSSWLFVVWMSYLAIPYRDVWPEAVYFCVKKTTLFIELFTYLIRVRDCSHFTSVLLLYSFWFLR